MVRVVSAMSSGIAELTFIHDDTLITLEVRTSLLCSLIDKFVASPGDSTVFGLAGAMMHSWRCR